MEALKKIYEASFCVTTASFVTGITLAVAEVANKIPHNPIVGGYVVFDHLIPDQTFWTTVIGLIGAAIMGASKTVEAVIAWRKHKAEMRQLKLKEEQLELDRFALTTIGDRRIKYKPVLHERRHYGDVEANLSNNNGYNSNRSSG